MMSLVNSDHFAYAYENILCTLYYHPEYITSPRGQKVHEIIDFTIKLTNPYSSLFKNDRRSSKKDYLAGEFEWYFSGRNDLKFIQRYASFWKDVANDNGTINSAYGYLIFTQLNDYNLCQYEFAINTLINDKDSRQAIMHFNNQSHQYYNNKDLVCTMYSIFNIRDNKLNMTVHMRSNDVILGLPNDIAFFTLLQIQAYHHLKQYHPFLEIGTYTHFVNSLHLYERNFQLVREMLSQDFKPDFLIDLEEDLVNISGFPEDNLKLKISKILGK